MRIRERSSPYSQVADPAEPAPSDNLDGLEGGRVGQPAAGQCRVCSRIWAGPGREAGIKHPDPGVKHPRSLYHARPLDAHIAAHWSALRELSRQVTR